MSQNRAYYLPTMICTNSRCGHFVTTSERLSSYAQWLPLLSNKKAATIFYCDRGFFNCWRASDFSVLWLDMVARSQKAKVWIKVCNAQSKRIPKTPNSADPEKDHAKPRLSDSPLTSTIDPLAKPEPKATRMSIIIKGEFNETRNQRAVLKGMGKALS